METRNMFCNNCGLRGHVFRSCTDPIISCGLLLLRHPTEKIKLPCDTSKAQVLMVRRKDSMAFVEFVRGKYDIENFEYVKRLVSNMTRHEQTLLRDQEFKILWTKVWGTSRDPVGQEYEESLCKFDMLDKELVLEGIQSEFVDPEWGFPKGRRSKGESDLECGIREFYEETNIPREAYTICENVSFIENFKGTNNVDYRHVYFVALLKDPSKVNLSQKLTTMQRREISAVSWKNISEAKDITRPHYTERKKVIENVERVISTFETL